MLVKIICENCKQEKEIEVRIPKFCSNECRKVKFIEMVKSRHKQNGDSRQTPSGENTMVSPSQPAENTEGEQGQTQC